MCCSSTTPSWVSPRGSRRCHHGRCRPPTTVVSSCKDQTEGGRRKAEVARPFFRLPPPAFRLCSAMVTPSACDCLPGRMQYAPTTVGSPIANEPIAVGWSRDAPDVGGTAVPLVCPPRKRGPRAVAGFLLHDLAHLLADDVLHGVRHDVPLVRLALDQRLGKVDGLLRLDPAG